MRRKAFVALFMFLIVTPLLAGESERGIRLETTVMASVDQVWHAWTTEEGLTFFAPASHVELRPGGAYEIFFDPTKPAGHRGADGNRVMLVQDKVAFAFTWNAPEAFPFARDQHTHVMIRLYPMSDHETRLVFTQDGFGEGKDWDKVREYFQKAWGEYVLPRLVARFDDGSAQHAAKH